MNEVKDVLACGMSPYEYLDYLQRHQFNERVAHFAADVGDVLRASLIWQVILWNGKAAAPAGQSKTYAYRISSFQCTDRICGRARA